MTSPSRFCDDVCPEATHKHNGWEESEMPESAAPEFLQDPYLDWTAKEGIPVTEDSASTFSICP